MYGGIAGAAVMVYFDDTWIQTLTPLANIPQSARWLLELGGGFVIGEMVLSPFVG